MGWRHLEKVQPETVTSLKALISTPSSVESSQMQSVTEQR